ncbi:MAG: DUF4278 domain-containing protein [Cyanosarcina radialis HA8281-LM2]|jgi:hypothetical protein|nr:DUF4278 domain-containing protein [Cyanosarcina radialis HA8281-LM2]
MKLTYRGNSYENCDRINSDSDSTDKLPIKLIYRGHAYCYNRRSVAASQEIETDGTNVTLIYRGNTYESKISTFEPTRIPLALNWRWHFN